MELVLKEYTQEGIQQYSDEILKKYLPQVLIDEYDVRLRRVVGAFIKDLKQQKERIDSEFFEGVVQREMAKQFRGLLLEQLTKEELEKIEAEGEKRYASKIPPGYRDAGKSNNQYGDLIIWNEVLKFAKNNNTSVIFVSRDLKDDWILELHGMKCGPRIELIKEFRKEVPDKLFHIYTLDKFIEYASRKEAVFNEKELNEMKSFFSEKEEPVKASSEDSKALSDVSVALKENVDDLKKTGEDFKAE